MMNISEKTVGILKNFSTINPSVLVNPGNVLSTVSPQKSIMAKAHIVENFPMQFAIYDLSRFLGVTSLMKDPDFSFKEQYVDIATTNQLVRYMYADPDQIIAPNPNREIGFPDPEVEFRLTSEELSSVIRAGSVLQLPEISLSGSNGKVFVTAVDSKNVSNDKFSIELGQTDYNFNMIIKSECLKLINATYDVAISSKGLVRFQSDLVTYWVATEANSTFGG